MKAKLLISMAALGMVATATALAADQAPAADPNGNMIGLTTPNGKLVYDFIDMWFNKHMAEAAWDKYVARQGYMNHAVYNATTKTVNKTFEEEKKEESRAAGPNTKFVFKQLIAQGNLVFVHIAASHGEGGVGPATGVPAAAPAGAAPAGAPPAGAGAPPPGGAMRAQGPGGPGMQGDGKGPDEMIMILRVNHGKIVDHWDLHVPTNSDSVVFEGLDRKLP
ncbi:MAG TPA: hypothetical protein VMI92_02405 [Steroidobacteraceae bacterium]|nr:hypothetical protein [Steroidobacteraceae bacterium]